MPRAESRNHLPDLSNPKGIHLALLFVLTFAVALSFLHWLAMEVGQNYWPIGVDVYPRWVGTRAFWNRSSPYASTSDLETQQLVYGRPAHPGEDPFSFTYPAYAAIVLAPLALLPVSFAAIVWSSFVWAIFATLVVALTLFSPNRLKPIPFAFLILATLLYRPALLSVLNGQYGLFVVGCWSLSWWMIRRRHPALAGGLLALSLLKPSLALIPVTFVVAWSLYDGRPRIAFGFLLAFGTLLLLSFAGIGFWLGDFLAQLVQYSRFLGTWTPRDTASTSGVIWLVLSATLVGIGLLDGRSHGGFPFYVFFGTVLLNLLVTPHTLEYDLVVLLLPLLFLLPAARNSEVWYGCLLLLISAPWITWFASSTLDLPIESWWKFVWQFYPSLVAFALIAARRAKVAWPPLAASIEETDLRCRRPTTR